MRIDSLIITTMKQYCAYCQRNRYVSEILLCIVSKIYISQAYFQSAFGNQTLRCLLLVEHTLKESLLCVLSAEQLSVKHCLHCQAGGFGNETIEHVSLMKDMW